MRFRFAIYAASFLVLSTSGASAFSMNFRWCGTGSSPVFAVSDVPKGTTTLEFHMDDLDYASSNHGGGTVAYTGQKSVPCGALQVYNPPAPPKGSHRYQITVTALGSGSAKLGSAIFTQEIPRVAAI